MRPAIGQRVVIKFEPKIGNHGARSQTTWFDGKVIAIADSKNGEGFALKVEFEALIGAKMLVGWYSDSQLIGIVNDDPVDIAELERIYSLPAKKMEQKSVNVRGLS